MDEAGQNTAEAPEGLHHYFAMVQNNLDVTCTTPFEIIPRHTFRRPTAQETERIREALERNAGPVLNPSMIFEREPTGPNGGPLRRLADSSQWRYWIIDVNGNPTDPINLGLIEIEQASRLCSVELRCHNFFYRNGDTGWAGWPAVLPLDLFSLVQPPVRFDADAAEQITSTHGLIRCVGAQFKEISRAVEKYHYLATLLNPHPLPNSQPFYLLGAFSVIESLLTHDPQGGYDSLGHQIKHKMKLLNRRFKTPLNYSPFGACDPTKVWSKLYALRSCIAHGSDPDFTRGELNLLRDAQTAGAFVDSAAKALLRQALVEPQLILDLRDC